MIDDHPIIAQLQQPPAKRLLIIVAHWVEPSARAFCLMIAKVISDVAAWDNGIQKAHPLQESAFASPFEFYFSLIQR